jgi:signal transduction histidine kinase
MTGFPVRTSEDAYATLAELARLGAGAEPPPHLAERALAAIVRAVGATTGAIVVEAASGPDVLASYGPAARDALHARCSGRLRAGGRDVGRIDCAGERPFDPIACRLVEDAGALLGPLLAGSAWQLKQNVLELRTLQRVAETVSRSLDLDEVLGRCLELALEVAHAPAGAIYLSDAKRGVYRRAQHRNTPEDVTPLELAAEPVDARLRDGGAVVVDQHDLGRSTPAAAAAARHGFRRIILLPLRVEGRTVGLLGVDFYAESSVSASTLLTLEAIAGHEAVAIENARAHAQAKLRTRLANVLREFSERALSMFDERELYQLTLATALTITRGDRGLVSRQTADRRGFRVVAATGKDERLVDQVMPANEPYVRDAGTQPLICEDVSTLSPDSIMGRVARENGTRSFLLFLMRYRGQEVGHVFAGSGETRRYEEAEVEAMHLLTAMAAEVIGRARGHADAEVQRKRLDAVIEDLPIVIAVLDRRGRVVHQNHASRALARAFGMPDGEDWRALGNLMQTLHPDGRPVSTDEQLIVRAFRGEHPAPAELTLAATDGSRRMHVMAMTAPLRDAEGNVSEVAIAFQDVSALRALADAKDRFLRVASHELRSPITSLRATTSLLELDPAAVTDPERRATMLQRIQRQVDRLIKLVEQLLDSARLNAPEVPIQTVECDLTQLAMEAIELAASSYGPSGRERVRLEAPPSLRGSWDPLRIEQVINNLVANALRYSPASTPVVVRLRDGAQPGDPARIEVIDRGIGIPPDQLEQVFSPFFRGTNAVAQHKGGLGLGLHITAEIVRRHGGEIHVRSELGSGSTFTVELPRRP